MCYPHAHIHPFKWREIIRKKSQQSPTGKELTAIRLCVLLQNDNGSQIQIDCHLYLLSLSDKWTYIHWPIAYRSNSKLIDRNVYEIVSWFDTDFQIKRKMPTKSKTFCSCRTHWNYLSSFIVWLFADDYVESDCRQYTESLTKRLFVQWTMLLCHSHTHTHRAHNWVTLMSSIYLQFIR